VRHAIECAAGEVTRRRRVHHAEDEHRAEAGHHGDGAKRGNEEIHLSV
jgi:hypothetical protein